MSKRIFIFGINKSLTRRHSDTIQCPADKNLLEIEPSIETQKSSPVYFEKKKQQQQQRVSNTVNNNKIPYVPEHRRHWNTQRRWEWRSRSARDCSDTWRCLAPRRPCTRPDWRLARMRVWWRRDTLALGTLCSQTAWLTRCTRTVLLDWLALAADPHTRHSNTF